MLAPKLEGVRFQPASDQSLLVYFGHEITLHANERIRKLLKLLLSEPIENVRNLHPAYCSLLVKFDPLKMTHAELETILQGYLVRLDSIALPDPRKIEIPVCYGGEFGPDLAEVAALHEMTPAQAVALHTSVTYVVYFLGFVPGYPYLGELPAALATPRLPNPRKQVPAGSVAIGGNQTGIYPFATPGGWRLIGRTPLALFRPQSANLSLLSIGDRVRFVSIPAEQFAVAEEQ
jgi:KipI family sensor histidine kinase inhibitor